MTSTTHTDVVCLGESMVTFLPSRPGRLADVPSFDRAIGGAESNVACAVVAAGHRARWLGRVGTDGFGDHLVETLSARGVDVSAVGRDPGRPTGIYFRTDGERATGLDAEEAEEGGARSEVVYYRAGSAASAMSPETVDLDAADDTRILHVSGITAALSADCLTLMRRLTAPRPGRPLVSFDVNYRVGLWEREGQRAGQAPAGPEVLLDLARGSDLVFVGEDEAEAAWGVTGGPRAVREALPEPAVLVVKQGSTGVTAFSRGAEGDSEVFVPALRVQVVASVGAGDAFAAGFLSGTLRGLPLRERLRHGHLTAAAALTEPGDLAEPAPAQVTDRLAALDDEAWGTLRLAPGWNHEKATAP